MKRAVRLLVLPILALLILEGSARTAAAACRLTEIAKIPVTMNGLRPTIPATINGSAAAFLLDSGAAHSVLSRAGAAEFKLHVVDEDAPPSPFDLAEREGLGRSLERTPSRFYLEGVGGDVRVSSTTVERFTLFNVPLSDVPFIVGGTAPAGVVGVVGQDLLRLGDSLPDVEYDFSTGAIRLMHAEGCDSSAPTYWASTGAYSVVDIGPMTLDSPYITATALLSGVKIRIMFDTGAPLSIVSLGAAARAGVTPQSAGVERAGRAYGLGPRTVPTWTAPFARIHIGSEEIRSVRLRIGDLGPSASLADMLIGADFFLSHRLYLARGERKLYFTYNGGPVFGSGAATSPAATEDSAPAQPESAEPVDAAGFALRGAAFAARDELRQAIADLTRACELDPQEPSYFYARGLMYWRAAQPSLAATDFDRALALRPNDVAALLARAELRFTERDASAARSDLDAASRLVPKEAGLRLALASVYLRLGLFTPAIDQYDLWIAAHAADARMAEALSGRCAARASLGRDLEDALADCDAALKLRPGDSTALDGRALAEWRLGKLDEAIADYDTALRLEPADAWALYGRGLARLREGQKTRGQTDIAAAAALQANIVEAAAKRGLAP